MSVCEDCGKEIIWGSILQGMEIPLDPAPPVYRAVEIGTPIHTDGQFIELAPGNFVSHFATCPKANDSSASQQQEPAPVQQEEEEPTPSITLPLFDPMPDLSPIADPTPAPMPDPPDFGGGSSGGAGASGNW